MYTSPLSGLHKQIWTALLAALIAAGAMIQLPIGPVPVTLQTYFIMLAGLVLGPLQGAFAMLLYLAAGAIGLPVFAGGKAGFAHLLGPTGGYLIGFIGTAVISGFGGGSKQRHIIVSLLFTLAGLLFVYLVGVSRLKFAIDTSWQKAFTIGMVPFVLGDIIKAAAAVASYQFLYKRRLIPA